MRGSCRQTDERGLSLVEAVVALAIVSLVGMAALGSAAAELRFAARAEEGLYARVLAEEVLARLHTMPAAELSRVGVVEGRFGPALPEWSWTATLWPTPRAPLSLHDVAITISGPSSSHQARSRIFLQEPAR